jgi:hypothetical protein
MANSMTSVTMTTSAQISLKKLLNLSNPLKEGWPKPILAQEVLSAVQAHDIFPEQIHAHMARDEFIKLVAYYYANPADELPTLNLGNMNDVAISWEDMHDQAKMAASIIKLAQENSSADLSLNVSGNKEVIESLFHVLPDAEKFKAENDDEKSSSEQPDEFLTIDWEANNFILNSTWDNEEYVTSQASKPTQDFFNKMSDRLKNNDEFLMELYKKNRKIINCFPDEIFYSSLFLEMTKENHDGFFNHWDKMFAGLFVEGNNSSSWIKKISNPGFKKKLLKFINDPENLINLLSHDNAHKIIPHIKPESRLEPRVAVMLIGVLNNAIENDKSIYISSGISVSNLLPEAWFEKDENALTFLRNLSKKVHIYSGDKIIWKNWVGNKEKLLEFLPEIKQEHLMSVLDDVPLQLRQDKEIVHEILKINPAWYNRLPDNMKKDLEIVRATIENSTNSTHVDQIPKNIIFSLQDKELIKQVLSNKPDLLVNKACPVAWRDDMDNLMAAAHRLHTIDFTQELPAKVWKKLSEPENAKKLMALNAYCYSSLTEEARQRPELALLYIKKYHKASLIPKELWSSQDFCIKSMKSLYSIEEEKSVYENIPKNFWSRQSFVLEVCKNIDEGDISKDILKIAPVKITQLLETFEANIGQYHDLMKDYFWKVNLQNKMATQNLLEEDEPVSVGKIKI